MMKKINIILGLSALAIQLSAQNQCSELVWSDEFDGTTLDLSKWEIQLGDGCPNLCGWGNAEMQSYTGQPENLGVADGLLRITAQFNEGGNPEVTSARLRTKNLASFTSGRIEASIKMPTGQGLWPAFWMLSEDEVYGRWPLSGEIDITELIGSMPSTTFGTIHYGAKWPNNQYNGENITLPFQLNQDFHNYAVEWKQDTIRWYFDDQLYCVRTQNNLGTFPWHFDEAFHLLLNVAVGGYFPGYPDATTQFPQSMFVDYVRIYQEPELAIISGPAYAPLSESHTYSIDNAMGAEVVWSSSSAQFSVSTGASAELVWTASGDQVLQATITHNGCTSVVERTIRVLNECVGVLTDFETKFGAHWTSFNGGMGIEPVPAANAVNNSSICLRWSLPPNEVSRLRFGVEGITDATAFHTAEKVLGIKYYTNAPPGSTVEVRFQNENISDGTGGTQSIYIQTTTASYAWSTMVFNQESSYTPAIDPTTINQLEFRLVGPQNLGYTFYIDDIVVYDITCVPTAIVENTDIAFEAFMTNDVLQISSSIAGDVSVFSVNGQIIHQQKIGPGNSQIDFPAVSGIYFVQLLSGQEQVVRKIFVP